MECAAMIDTYRALSLVEKSQAEEADSGRILLAIEEVSGRVRGKEEKR